MGIDNLSYLIILVIKNLSEIIVTYEAAIFFFLQGLCPALPNTRTSS